MTCWYSLSHKFYKFKRYILSNAKKTTTLPMSLIDNEITKHVLIWFTVNVAYSRSQSIQGQATMSEPPQHRNWQAYKVIDGNTNQTANGSSCAIIEFYKRYTSVWLSIHLQRLFNVAYTEIYFRNEGSKFRKKSKLIFIAQIVYQCV